MQRQNVFAARAKGLIAGIAALMGGTHTAMMGVKAANHAQALEMLGGYQSRGKRKTKKHDHGGSRMAQRLAQKKRNQVRNRKAHRRAQGKGA